MDGILLCDLEARRTFDAYNVLRRVAHDLAGVRVIPAEANPRASSAYGATSRLRLDDGQRAFEDDLRAILAGVDGAVVVIPSNEELLERIAALSPAQEWARLALRMPPASALGVALDKAELPAACAAAGVRTPRLLAPPWTREALVASLPLVVKPRRGRGAVGVRFLDQAADVVASPIDAATDLVSERVAGGAVAGAFYLYDAGVCLGRYGHERVRTFPASGGVSTCAIRRDDDAVLDAGQKLLDHLKWSGLAMVELMRDEKTGEWVVIEINPRLWGTILLDEHSGAFLLRNYVLRCLGRSLQPSTSQPSSHAARFRWAAGELLHAASTHSTDALRPDGLFGDDTAWSGVTYAEPKAAARFLLETAASPKSLAKLRAKWRPA